MMMKSAAFALSALMMGAAASAASAQTNVTINETAPVLTLNISETVDGAPDIAMVNSGVQTRAMSATEAMSGNAAKMTKLIAALEKAGIAKKDMQTAGISLSPQYDYSPRNPDGTQAPPRFIGYEASNQLNVKLRDVAKVGGLLDTLVAAGATNIGGPSFAIDDPAPLLVQARDKALKSATTQAQYYAQQTGYRSVRLVSLSESVNDGPRPMPMMASRFKADMAAAPTPVEPGQLSVGVSLTVQYALEK